MKLQDWNEVKAALRLLEEDKSEELLVFDKVIYRSELVIAIYTTIKELDISSFSTADYNSMLAEEYKKYHYMIHQYELDMDYWQYLGTVKGKFLTIDQAYAKLKSLDNEDNKYWFQIVKV